MRRRSPVPQNEYVSVRDLAASLGVDCERLRPLIERQYLKVLEVHDYLDDCLVGRPQPAALAWLSNMFKPLMMRPILPADIAAELLRVTLKDFRRLCIAYNAPLCDDPAFGELITLRDFYTLFSNIHKTRGTPYRFDRQALLSLTRISDHTIRADVPLPYNVKIEQEIRRIAALPEPDRTVRAVALCNAYRDAQTVTQCYAAYKNEVVDSRPEVEAALDRLMRKCAGNKEGDPGQEVASSIHSPAG